MIIARRLTKSGMAHFAVGAVLGLGLVWLLSRNPLEWSELGSRLGTFTTIFMGIFIEAAPFLLLGTMASGLVEVYLSPQAIRRWMPKGALTGVLAGSALGLLFPVCECGTVPLTRRLLRKGLPLPIGIAFLLAAPVMNPIVLASTAAAFGFGPVLVWRIMLTFAIAAITGLIFSVESEPARLQRSSALAPIRDASGAPQPRGSKLRRVSLIAGDEFFEMGRYLIIGSLLAAGMQTLIPQSTLLNVASGPILSIVVMMALGVLLSVCSTVDSFVALAFMGSFAPGSILGFLVYGPMVDIKSTLMYLTVLKRRAVLYLILLPLVLTLAAATSLNLFLLR